MNRFLTKATMAALTILFVAGTAYAKPPKRPTKPPQERGYCCVREKGPGEIKPEYDNFNCMPSTRRECEVSHWHFYPKEPPSTSR